MNNQNQVFFCSSCDIPISSQASQRGLPEIILEHDSTKVHGELAYENEKTLKRNQDYARANRPFFVINEDLAKLLDLDQAKLATYLYYHTLSQCK